MKKVKLRNARGVVRDKNGKILRFYRLEVDLFPKICFLEKVKGGRCVGFYNYRNSTLEIMNSLSFFWKVVVILHELGHHVITVLTHKAPCGGSHNWYENAWLSFKLLYRILNRKDS